MKLPEGGRKMLGKTAFANVATLMADGGPQVTPMWVDVEDSLIVLNTAEGRLKLANMRRDARVAICVQDPDDAYTYLAIRGHVVDITHEGAEAHADELARQYLGQDEFPREVDPSRRVIVRVAPERIAFVSDA